MLHLTVYFNTDEDYERTKNANLWVSINGSHLLGPIDANRELIRGEVQTALLQKERYDPVGVFSPTGAFYMMKGSDGKSHPLMYGEAGDIPPINYVTISPADLRNRLLGRLRGISEYLKDSDIEIECFRGVPPGI